MLLGLASSVTAVPADTYTSLSSCRVYAAALLTTAATASCTEAFVV